MVRWCWRSLSPLNTDRGSGHRNQREWHRYRHSDLRLLSLLTVLSTNDSISREKTETNDPLPVARLWPQMNASPTSSGIDVAPDLQHLPSDVNAILALRLLLRALQQAIEQFGESAQGQTRVRVNIRLPLRQICDVNAGKQV